MKSETEYWQNMGLVVPTRLLVDARKGRDIKFEANIVGSKLVLPNNELDSSFLELLLDVPEHITLFKAQFTLSNPPLIPGYGQTTSPKINFVIAEQIYEEVKNNPNSSAVFGGEVKKIQTSWPKYEDVILNYVEFPGSPEKIFRFDRQSPLVSLPSNI